DCDIARGSVIVHDFVGEKAGHRRQNIEVIAAGHGMAMKGGIGRSAGQSLKGVQVSLLRAFDYKRWAFDAVKPANGRAKFEFPAAGQIEGEELRSVTAHIFRGAK